MAKATKDNAKKTEINLPSTTNIHHYWGTIRYLSELIKSSELKAGLILSFYGIILNFIYQSTKGITQTIFHDYIMVVLLISWVLCTACSIFYCVRCFIPRIEGNYDKNMFFYKDIISSFGSINEFSEAFFGLSTNDQALFKQLGEQIFIISKISDWKFRNVKRAINLLAIGLVLLFLSGMYLAILFYV